MEKDVDTKAQAAVIDTRNVTALPIVIKIETPKDVEKKKKTNNKSAAELEDDAKPTKSRFCQLLPVLLFLVTFATVLSVLIVYLDPSSEYNWKKKLFSANLRFELCERSFDDGCLNDDDYDQLKISLIELREVI